METAPSVGAVSFRELISSERCLITSGVVARREPILEVGLFDESLRTAQDFDLWLRLARSGARLMYHRKTLLRYRIHAGSLTGDPLNTFRRESNVLDKIENSYDLTASEKAQVSPLIRARRGFLEFEMGKLLIAQGDVTGAQNAFQKACASGRNWKRQAAFWGSRMAPRSMQAFCLRRLQKGGREVVT